MKNIRYSLPFLFSAIISCIYTFITYHGALLFSAKTFIACTYIVGIITQIIVLIMIYKLRLFQNKKKLFKFFAGVVFLFLSAIIFFVTNFYLISILYHYIMKEPF